MVPFPSPYPFDIAMYIALAVIVVLAISMLGFKFFISASTNKLKLFVEDYKNVDRASHNRVDDLTEWVTPEFYTAFHSKKILQYFETGVLPEGLDYEKLLRSRVTLVLYFLSRDVNTPPDVLFKLSKSSRAEDIPLEALSNPSVPVEALEKAAASYHFDIRQVVAANPKTPSEILAKFVNDIELISTVLDNPNADTIVFQTVLLDHIKDVKTVPKNMIPGWTFYAVQSMVNHPNIGSTELKAIVNEFPELADQATHIRKDVFTLDYLMKKSTQFPEYGIAAIKNYRPQLNVLLEEQYGMDAKDMPDKWVMHSLGWV